MTEKEINTAIERIREMEKLFDIVNIALSKMPALLFKNRSLKSAVLLLSEYYESGLWLRDYELDEAGLIPAELKRGVLSQDGLYNILSEIDEIKKGR